MKDRTKADIAALAAAAVLIGVLALIKAVTA